MNSSGFHSDKHVDFWNKTEWFQVCLQCLVYRITRHPGFYPSCVPGGYSIYPWVGRCGAAHHTLTLFKTNIAEFPTLFKTEFRFFNTLVKTFNPNIN